MDDTKGQVWDKVVARLRAELGEEVFTSWFGRVEFVGLEDGALHLSVPTRFLRKWLISHYYDRVLNSANAEFAKIDDCAVKSVSFAVRQPVAVKDQGEVAVSTKSSPQ